MRIASEYIITFDLGEETGESTSTITEDRKLTTLPSPTRSGYHFNGWFTEETGGEKVNSNTVFDETDTIYARWTRTDSEGGETTTYSIVVDKAENGKAFANKTYASAGSTVALTVTPDENYKLNSLTVKDSKGNEIALTKNSNGIYSFKMPSSKVTVKAAFVKIDSITNCNGDQNCPAYHFTDLTLSKWYHDGIHYCVESGLMLGTTHTTFAPHMSASRGMIATSLYRLEGSPAVSGTSSFDDVAAGKYYTDAIIWAEKNGIVEGYGDNKFGPDDAITREQMATILYRYAQYKGYDVSDVADLANFSDAASISGYAKPALSWANATGLVEGDGGKLMPKDNAERCQVAAILMRFCNKFVR